MSDSVNNIIEAVEKLSVLELAELIKAIEEKFGVSAAAPAMMAAVPTGGATGDDVGEEKTSFTVELLAAGDNKINVIKAVREVTGLGLSEAKALVDGAPKSVKENVNKEEADKVKAALEAAGAKVAVK